MTQIVPRQTYSADVRLYLAIGTRQLGLSHIGPDHVLLREPVNLEPCEADVISIIDGTEYRWRVFLVNGAVPFDHEVEIRDVP